MDCREECLFTGAVAGMRVDKLLYGFIVILTLVGQVAAQELPGDKKYGEYFEEEKKWSEAETPLPDFPREQHLIEFDAGAATRNRYFIDGSTLSVGGDGVIRYAILVKTSGGAANVSYEGIRCDVRERKLFAVGRADNTWTASRAQNWQPIRIGSYQAVLLREYFCPNKTAIIRPEEGVDALKRGGHPDAR